MRSSIESKNRPLTVGGTNENLITSNVSGILKNLDPKIWLRRFLGEAIKGKDFSKHTFENLSFEFWKRYRPPVNMVRVTATKHVWSIVEGLRGDLRPNNITV